jgi:hypothetical protein
MRFMHAPIMQNTQQLLVEGNNLLCALDDEWLVLYYRLLVNIVVNGSNKRQDTFTGNE